MTMSALCLLLSATLTITPNKVQFFQYEHISLSCEAPAGSSIWRVKRNTSGHTSEACDRFGIQTESSCTIMDTFPSDNGVYWCESEKWGARSTTLNITIVKEGVILKSPAHPVTEGDKVTLVCSYTTKAAHTVPTSDFSAAFYRDSVFIGKHPHGKLLLPAVTKSDEGFYKCQHPTKAESKQSPLIVRVRPTPPPASVHVSLPRSHPPMSVTMLLCLMVVFPFYVVIIAVCIYAYKRWVRARAERRIYEYIGVRKDQQQNNV